jgi:hypothetical protein
MFSYVKTSKTYTLIELEELLVGTTAGNSVLVSQPSDGFAQMSGLERSAFSVVLHHIERCTE